MNARKLGDVLSKLVLERRKAGARRDKVICDASTCLPDGVLDDALKQTEV